MSNIIVEKDSRFLIQFDFNRRVSKAVLKVPEVEYNHKYRRWEAPIHAADAVFRFGAKFGFILPEKKSRPNPFHQPTSELPELKHEIEGLKMNLFPYQRNGVAYALEKGSCIMGDAPGLGKAQPMSSLIATPEGFKRMSDIKVGDSVFGRDGCIYQIEAIYPQGKRPVYRIAFNDGVDALCDSEHLWSVTDRNRVRRGTGWVIKSTSELLVSGVSYHSSEKRILSGRKPSLKWQIPLCGAVNYPQRDYLIHPYVLGAMIGDGNLHIKNGRAIAISIPEEKNEIKEKIKSLLPENLKLKESRYPSCPQYFFTQSGTTSSNPFKNEIKRLGLITYSRDRFIPADYLYGSVEQRTELLKGLMDTDGSSIKNRITYHTVSNRLANDISELVRSLGGQAIVREYNRDDENKGTEYQVNIHVNFNPFCLKRKAEQYKRFDFRRYIESIEYIGEEETQCIKVSAPDHLYLTDNYIVTHNTAQAIAAIVAADLFPCLVICPASLKYNWLLEWKLWTDRHDAAILTDAIKNTWSVFHQMGLHDVFITNYESLKKYFVVKIETPKGERFKVAHIRFNPNMQLFKSVIIDESHKCKDASTMQSKLCYGLTRDKEMVLLLTGTPIVNRPVDLLSQILMVGKMQPFGTISAFREMCADEERWPEINAILRNNCYFRREKQSVLKDLPDKYRQKVYCNIDNREEYRAALSDLAVYLAEYRQATDEQIMRSMRGEIMVRIGVLKNIAARGKMNDVMEYIDNIVEQGEKIVVFIYLNEIAEKLRDRYPDALFFTGAQSEDERNRALDDFQRCEQCGVRFERHGESGHDFVPSSHQVIFVNYKAGGVGITLTASSIVLFVELPWHPADVEQAESRCHRISQKNAVQVSFFIGKDTIDEQIMQIIEDKREMSEACTGAVDHTEESIIHSIMELIHHA
jgi:SNF2 family DNA or RNA helicase